MQYIFFQKLPESLNKKKKPGFKTVSPANIYTHRVDVNEKQH